MYCRNCGNEVHDKAVACPKCGVNPRSEKKFCSACGVETNPNQVVCTKCGVSLAGASTFSLDTSSLQNIDVRGLIRNPAVITPFVALIACFFPWVKMSAFVVSTGFSLFSLAAPFTMADTVLAPGLLYLLPLSLIGLIVSVFVPKVEKFKKIFAGVAVFLIIYAAIGLYQLTNPSAPEPTATNQNDMMGNIMSMAQNMSRNVTKNLYSIGWGFYFAALATLASAFFSGLLSKKKS